MSFLCARALYVCQQAVLKEYEESDRAARINSNIGIAEVELEETMNATALAKELLAPPLQQPNGRPRETK